VASLPAQDVLGIPHQRGPVETPSGVQQKQLRWAGMCPSRWGLQDTIHCVISLLFLALLLVPWRDSDAGWWAGEPKYMLILDAQDTSAQAW